MFFNTISASSAAAPFSLDGLTPGMESAWSTGRRLLTAYTGPIVRVRRSSDNAEQDFFGLGASGAVDASAVAAFCGAGDGFVRTIYDQSGLSRNLIQTANTAHQPQCVASGVAVTENGRLAAAWDGTTTPRHMVVNSSVALYNFLHNGTESTAYSVQRVTDDARSAKYLWTTINGPAEVGMFLNFTSAELMNPVIRGPGGTPAVNVSKSGAWVYNVATYFFDADNATAADREDIWRDGVLVGTDNAATAAVSTDNAARDFRIGGNSSNAANFAGNICELVFWSQDRRSNRSIWETSAKTFWGTP
jgi:hypothetical protein